MQPAPTTALPPPTLPLPLLLLLLLLSTLASSALAWTPRLPTHIDAWAYTQDWDSYRLLRSWDRATLHHATKEANHQQMHGMLRKLHSGQAVTVAAFGDSITASHGGCFNDAEHSGAVQQQDPCAVGKVLRLPWLETFMQMIHNTWPHPDHKAVNLGIPGSSFRTFAEGECIEQHLPHQLDLIILEHLPYMEMKDSTIREAERLLHRLWLHLEAPLPAVIFLNMHLALEGESGEPSNMCIQDPSQCDTCPNSFNALPRPESLSKPAELQTYELARYYGMAALSYVSAVNAMLLADTPRRLGMSKCQFFSSLYLDRVHPRDSGRLLIADLLVNYLVSSEQHLGNMDPGATNRHAAAAPALPPHPMDLESNTVYRMRCYYSAAPTVAPAAAAAVVGPMQMARAEGWEFVERDGESQKYKPGWVASAPGAVLWVQLDLDLPDIAARNRARRLNPFRKVPEPTTTGGAGPGSRGEPAADAPSTAAAAVGERVDIMITILKSYRHMGRAQVSCLEACSCGPLLVDAHEPNYPHSIPEIKILPAFVTASTGRCLLQFVVQPETSSGQHKFKVAAVAVGNLRDMTEPLQLVARRAEQYEQQQRARARL